RRRREPRRSGPRMSERRREVALAGHRGDTATARGALTDSDPAVRATAIGALERLGALDVTDLQRALEDASPVVRRRACDAVALLPGDQAPSLLPLLEDDDATVAEVAAWACGERQPPE